MYPRACRCLVCVSVSDNRRTFGRKIGRSAIRGWIALLSPVTPRQTDDSLFCAFSGGGFRKRFLPNRALAHLDVEESVVATSFQFSPVALTSTTQPTILFSWQT